jgi:L,D-peptidoglycan transpeptidase YkuD (ErfK/YbiS/YcfS/YnhG family)
LPDFFVSTDPSLGAVLDWGAGARRCAVGRGGIGEKLKEGDGITPIGVFPVRYVLYRPDRIAPPKTGLETRTIGEWDGWCDAPGDPAYNRAVTLPYAASAENLWRQDHLYDVIAVLGFNDDPVVDGKGSAIFLHVARPDYSPTEGCVALAMDDLLAALDAMKSDATIEIRS